MIELIPGERARRSYKNPADGMCPVEWKVNMNARRKPSQYMEAECKRQTGSCLTHGNQPACIEIKKETVVYWFIGISKDTGEEMYRCEKVSIPVACSCSVL